MAGVALMVRHRRAGSEPRTHDRSNGRHRRLSDGAPGGYDLASSQNDIKRMLVFSTVLQARTSCSWRLGVGAFPGGLFHLDTHAFFKALLFLGSGALIHALHGEQDLRDMVDSGRSCRSPIGRFSPARSPLPACRSSWASRRTRFCGRPSRTDTPCSGLAVVTAFPTATYMFRLLYLAFFGPSRGASLRAALGLPARRSHRRWRSRLSRRRLTRWWGAMSAFRMRLCMAATASKRFWSRASRAPTAFAAQGEAAGQQRRPPKAGRRVARHGHRAGAHAGLHTGCAWAASLWRRRFSMLESRALAEAIAARFPGLHRLLLSILRGPTLRRGHRAADPGHFVRLAVARYRCLGRSTAPSTAWAWSCVAGAQVRRRLQTARRARGMSIFLGAVTGPGPPRGTSTSRRRAEPVCSRRSTALQPRTARPTPLTVPSIRPASTPRQSSRRGALDRPDDGGVVDLVYVGIR